MPEDDHDILIDIPDDDLPKLLDMYDNHKDWIPQAYSAIYTGIEWKKKSKEKYMTFMSPNGCWREDGTFFIVLAHYCFDVFVFSLEDTGRNIYEGITKSKRLDPDDYTDKQPYLFAVHYKFYAIVSKGLEENGVTSITEIVNNVFCIPREEALAFVIECPPDVCIKKIDKRHADMINSIWPHRYKNSEKFISLLIDMNDNYGVFLKSTNELVAWVLLSMIGQLTVLQTVDTHKKKGYACLITRYVSRELAKKGYNALGTVLLDNRSSEGMFKKLGFKNLGIATFISFS